MAWTTKALHSFPELAMFLAVAIGFWLGNIKFGKFALGTVTTALLAGLLIGQVGVEINRELRWGFFYLFLFANGYSAGPQFFRALKHDGVKPMVLSITVAVAGLTTAFALSRLLNLDPGMTAGLFSGSLTQSSAIGTGSDAVMSLALPLEQRKLLVSHIAIADALTYVFGALGMIWFVSIVAPKLMRIDLRKEGEALDDTYGIKTTTPGVFSAYKEYSVRAYRLTESAFIGKSIAEVERTNDGERFFVERVHRADHMLDVEPSFILQRDDVVVVWSRVDSLLCLGPLFGAEVDDPKLLDFPAKVLDLVVTNEQICGSPLQNLAMSRKFDFRGIALTAVTRAGQEIPIGPNTVLQRGDLVTVIGRQRTVDNAARTIGYALTQSNSTTLSIVGFGILVGALIGLPFIMIGDIKLTLSVSVGTLVAGLLFGWMRSIRPNFGNIPQPALQFMIDFGLAAFVAGAGLQAGPEFVHAVKDLGLPLLLAGVVVTLIPQFVALAVGRYLLKMNPLMLLGALAGAQTFTAALAAVQEKSGSRTAVLGYTVPYAISNILLTVCGSIIVFLVT